MKRIAVLTSGGDAPGMNAAIRATVRKALSLDMEVYGIQRGYEGLLDDEMERMEWTSVSDILQRGGTILRTARSKKFMMEGGIERGKDILESHGIEGLVVIGGDGSLRGALELSKRGVSVMGLPGTIDNDLAYTDFTIGFDTAVNTVLSMISNIRDTSSSHERTTVIEVMGRSCGDIALYAGLAGGADAVLIPEEEPDMDALIGRVLAGQKTGRPHSIIIKAEGVGISTQELTKIIEERTAREARSVVLGYVQRGGTPTSNDRILASMTAGLAVDLLYREEKSKAIGTVDGKIVAVDLEEAMKMERGPDFEMMKLTEILS